jgi:replicative DNA helicase
MATDKKKRGTNQSGRQTGMTIDDINAQYGKLPPQAVEVE